MLRSCFDLIACIRSTIGTGCVSSGFFSFILTSNIFSICEFVGEDSVLWLGRFDRRGLRFNRRGEYKVRTRSRTPPGSLIN
jgi:hypothetical protein